MSAEPIPDPTPAPEPDKGGTPVCERSDRVHWFAGRVHQVLDGLGDPQPFGLRPGEVAEAVVELERAAARLSGLALRLLAQADREDATGASSVSGTAGWLRGLVPVAPRDGRRQVRLARSLAQGHEAVDRALVAGRVLTEQAEVICAAVDAPGNGELAQPPGGAARSRRGSTDSPVLGLRPSARGAGGRRRG
jgi:hypothetical protein